MMAIAYLDVSVLSNSSSSGIWPGRIFFRAASSVNHDARSTSGHV